MTKIVGTLGPKSRSVEVITACLKAGMSGKPPLYFLQSVKPGDTIFIGQYLFTGSETTSIWLEVWLWRLI
ncbi:hypothetical protein BHM03_00043593 [Ensete ventricosum]|nr:hypothetical protein BHM03_00043593 [Ensete ventricosum]